MTGAEHYEKAEQLLAEADRDLVCGNFAEAARVERTAAVHAQLAQVQATLAAGAGGRAYGRFTDEDVRA